MTSAAPAPTDSGANIFQKYLIPEESKWVRFSMLKAGEFANRSNFLLSHFLSVGCAVAAVAMSFFNTFSYLLQIPFEIPLKIVQFDPIGIATGITYDLMGVAKSIVFVSMGATFVVAGLIFPREIFTHFAPEHYLSLEARLSAEVASLQKSSLRKDAEINELNETATKSSEKVVELEEKIKSLKHPIRRWLPKFC
ncbi:MAG: hypothetical protein P0S96_01610 [Simkaniaceae bacterium]|nr:hypothetical protein [Candidatus Sacchlamyda saccharinae]